MKASGVSKISVVTTIGAGDSMEQAPWAWLLMMTVMSSIMADKNKQEELFPSGPGADLEYASCARAASRRPLRRRRERRQGRRRRDRPRRRRRLCLDAAIEDGFAFSKQAVCINSNMGSGFASILADKTKSRMAA